MTENKLIEMREIIGFYDKFDINPLLALRNIILTCDDIEYRHIEDINKILDILFNKIGNRELERYRYVIASALLECCINVSEAFNFTMENQIDLFENEEVSFDKEYKYISMKSIRNIIYCNTLIEFNKQIEKVFSNKNSKLIDIISDFVHFYAVECENNYENNLHMPKNMEYLCKNLTEIYTSVDIIEFIRNINYKIGLKDYMDAVSYLMYKCSEKCSLIDKCINELDDGDDILKCLSMEGDMETVKTIIISKLNKDLRKEEINYESIKLMISYYLQNGFFDFIKTIEKMSLLESFYIISVEKELKEKKILRKNNLKLRIIK